MAALGLGGAEVNPLCFQPFGGYGDAMTVTDGAIELPSAPGIGFQAWGLLVRKRVRETPRHHTLATPCSEALGVDNINLEPATTNTLKRPLELAAGWRWARRNDRDL
jgi:hypothetical protein